MAFINLEQSKKSGGATDPVLKRVYKIEALEQEGDHQTKGMACAVKVFGSRCLVTSSDVDCKQPFIMDRYSRLHSLQLHSSDVECKTFKSFSFLLLNKDITGQEQRFIFDLPLEVSSKKQGTFDVLGFGESFTVDPKKIKLDKIKKVILGSPIVQNQTVVGVVGLNDKRELCPFFIEDEILDQLKESLKDVSGHHAEDQRPATEEKKEYKGDGESKAASDETQSKRQAGGKSNLQGDRDTTDAGKTEKEPVEDERRLKITLATNDEGCRITITNQLLGELVQNPLLEVSAFVPSLTQELIDWAATLEIQLIEAEEGKIGFDDKDLLIFPPANLDIDILIIHSYGLDLGRQAQLIKEKKRCKWVHVVHTNSQELEKYLENKQEASLQSKQHDVQLALCKQADIVIAIGPKLADFYRPALRSSGVEVFDLTPEIIPDLIGVRPVCEDDATFRVLISATYHDKYFRVKGCDIAAKAISLLKDTSYHIIFAVLDTDNAKQLQTQVEKEIKLSQFTVQTCSRDPVQWSDLLCAVNLAILPSRAEGFGTSCLRAMSADLPVLVSGNTGLGMALKKLPSKGKRQVVYSEDPQHWADRIREVKEMEAESRADEAKKLRTEYMEEFNWKKQCGDLVEKMFGMFPNKKDGSEGSASGTRRQDDVVDTPRTNPKQ